MLYDVKGRLCKEPQPRYSMFERVLFIGGGVLFCFAFACGLLGVGL